MVIRIGPTAAHPEGKSLTVARVRLDRATTPPTAGVPPSEGVRESVTVNITSETEASSAANEATAYDALGARAQAISALTPEAGAQRLQRLSMIDIEQGLGEFGVSPTGEITSQKFSIPMESIDGSGE